MVSNGSVKNARNRLVIEKSSVYVIVSKIYDKQFLVIIANARFTLHVGANFEQAGLFSSEWTRDSTSFHNIGERESKLFAMKYWSLKSNDDGEDKMWLKHPLCNTGSMLYEHDQSSVFETEI